MRLKYNAPITLTFSLISALIMLLTSTVLPNLNHALFTVPGNSGMNWASPLDYLRLFSHIAGHKDWAHLLGNFAYILLLGPILEEKYKSSGLLMMILVTALVTGLLNVIFLSTGLLGASGIVFMMILLSSFTNMRSGDIPITFILVATLYLVQEITQMFADDGVSQFAHILGGLAGAFFGFLAVKLEENPPPAS